LGSRDVSEVVAIVRCRLLSGRSVRMHTGAGRLTRLRMRPMSLYESGVGTGQVSLAALLAGEPARSADPGLTVAELAR
jgi:hypothetical protein